MPTRNLGCLRSHMPNNKHNHPTAFTLVEVLLATVVGALVLAVAVAAYTGLTRSRDRIERASETLTAGRYAMQQIRNDLANLYRSADPARTRFVGIPGGSADDPADRIIVYVVRDRPVNDQNVNREIFEVEYGLVINDDGNTSLAQGCTAVSEGMLGNERGALRRLAENVPSLQFQFFDGQDWQRAWDSTHTLPPVVRVTMSLAGADPDAAEIELSQVIAMQMLPQAAARKAAIERDHTPRKAGGPGK